MLDQDIRILRERLIPLVLNTVLLHPSEADGLFAACPGANELPMGRGALEPALWDLYGKVVEQPLWQLIGGQAPEGTDAVAVPAGAAIPVGPALRGRGLHARKAEGDARHGVLQRAGRAKSVP